MNNTALENSPLIVGVAAHPDVDPAQLAHLTDASVRFLQDLKQHLPDTVMRVMLDPGTEAGLAVARAALGLDLVVDALCARPTHRTASAPGRQRLPELAGDARVSWIDVTAGIDGAQQDSNPGATACDAILRRSSLLLALWDGRPSGAPDDTADQVFRFLGVRGQRAGAVDKFEVTTDVDHLDSIPQLVFWVPAQRNGLERAEGVQEPHYLLAAGDNVLDVKASTPPSLRRRLEDLNEYNRDGSNFCADPARACSESLMRDLPETKAMRDASFIENIDRQFVKADSLAGHMQRQSDRLFNMFGIMAFTMGVAYLVYDKITEARILLVVYSLILAAGVLAYYLFKAKHFLSKYLAYRALAETLRVRFYLALTGVDHRIHTRQLITLSGIYRFPHFSWLSFVLDAIEPTSLEMAHSGEAYSARTRLVEKAWIEDQYQYFARKVAQLERSRFWIGRLKRSVLLIALTVLSAMFIFGEGLHHIDARTGLPLKNVLTFFSGLLALVLGVWELRQNKMAVQELLWQYRSQLSEFKRVRIQLRRISSRDRRDDILSELGANSLMEIYLWAIHRYHREHAPPGAH